MRPLITVLAPVVFLGCMVGCGKTNTAQVGTTSETGDGPQVTIGDHDTPEEILAKARQALGGQAKLKRWKVGKIKYRIEPQTPPLPPPYVDVTTENTFQLPGKFKSVNLLKTKAGKEVSWVTVGINGWAWVRGHDGVTHEEADNDSKRDLHFFAYFFFSDLFMVDGWKWKPGPDVKLTVLHDTEDIDGRAVVVLLVQSTEGKIYYYFEKSSALVLRQMKIAIDPATQQKVIIETSLSEYKSIEGGKVPMRARTYRGGELIGDMVILDLQFLDKIDDSEFAKP